MGQFSTCYINNCYIICHARQKRKFATSNVTYYSDSFRKYYLRQRNDNIRRWTWVLISTIHLHLFNYYILRVKNYKIECIRIGIGSWTHYSVSIHLEACKMILVHMKHNVTFKKIKYKIQLDNRVNARKNLDNFQEKYDRKSLSHYSYLQTAYLSSYMR